MARIKVINKGQNQDLIGGNFKNAASETVFSFGNFKLDSNFAGKTTIDYSNELSSFVTPITLETLNINDSESQAIFDLTTNATLNFDRSDLKNFVKFGSTREILRVSVEQVISKYPASLFVNSQIGFAPNPTVTEYSFDELTDISQFKIPVAVVENKFGLVFNRGNTSSPNGDVIKNINISFGKYVVWRKDDSENNTHNILGFTGDTQNSQFIQLSVQGNPFLEASGGSATVDYHLKPEPLIYNKFKANLEQLEEYLVKDRKSDSSGYAIYFKEPTLLETGEIIYTDRRLTWGTTDSYNVDFEGAKYQRFLDSLILIGEKYDTVKTDLIARFLVPASIKTYDLTDEGKMTKLLRIYGREFDEMRQFIDSLVNINTVTYNKKNDVPNQLVKNLAKSLGWDVFTIVSEQQLAESFFSSEEEMGSDDLLPAEVDLELWRRIIINTNYFWKAKGTRHALKAMLLLIGIPDPFINITEYIYTVDGKIDPNSVELSIEDLPSASFPFDSEGYPIAPVETNDFYFQISGNADSGQAYMDNFRNVGFVLNRIADNKKSWDAVTGLTFRRHETTPSYFQTDSRLVLNTKEIDATLDIARGIEYDVYCYNETIDDLISTGTTTPYIFVNIPFEYGVSANTFTIPDLPLSGSNIQVNFNGLTLTESGTSGGDYTRTSITGVTLNDKYAITHSNGEKDIITLTYLFDKLGTTGYTTVEYIVQIPTIKVDGTEIYLAEEPKGDVQLIVNGITLTKGTSLFVGDFIIDPHNPTKIFIQNSALQQYLLTNPIIRVWCIKDGALPSNAEKRSEAFRVDAIPSLKVRYNAIANQYSYLMDYKAFDIDSIKITLNGVTLQNTTDFTLDSANKAHVNFKVGVSINFGDVIGAYYIVDDGSFSTFILPPDPLFPSVDDMSFLEYLELINRRLINVKNRKTISDFKGGYYPTVLKIYEEYMKRSFRPEGDILKSNGYTFEILYPFIERYGAFFSRFVNELLPATIIQRKAGILIRNTAFTKQKFMYRRGVNFDPELQYFGDNGAEYVIKISTGTTGITTTTTTLPPTTTTTTLPPTTTTTTLPPTTTTTTTSPITTTTTTAADEPVVFFAFNAPLIHSSTEVTNNGLAGTTLYQSGETVQTYWTTDSGDTQAGSGGTSLTADVAFNITMGGDAEVSYEMGNNSANISGLDPAGTDLTGLNSYVLDSGSSEGYFEIIIHNTATPTPKDFQVGITIDISETYELGTISDTSDSEYDLKSVGSFTNGYITLTSFSTVVTGKFD